jgi:sugar/nucleoside kinase (ribokinase family)
VKIGKDGAWIAQDQALHRIAPRQVAQVVDTNGAGDAWAAGFLTAHLRGWPLPRCGELASLLGAETVGHLGPIIPVSQWPAVHAQARTLGPL